MKKLGPIKRYALVFSLRIWFKGLRLTSKFFVKYELK
jgi:hypothetical protein